MSLTELELDLGTATMSCTSEEVATDMVARDSETAPTPERKPGRRLAPRWLGLVGLVIVLGPLALHDHALEGADVEDGAVRLLEVEHSGLREAVRLR